MRPNEIVLLSSVLATKLRHVLPSALLQLDEARDKHGILYFNSGELRYNFNAYNKAGKKFDVMVGLTYGMDILT